MHAHNYKLVLVPGKHITGHEHPITGHAIGKLHPATITSSIYQPVQHASGAGLESGWQAPTIESLIKMQTNVTRNNGANYTLATLQ